MKEQGKIKTLNSGGVYGMKPLGGGNLLSTKKACFDFVLNLDVLDSIAFCMQSFDEIDYNVKRIKGKIISTSLEERLKDHLQIGV